MSEYSGALAKTQTDYNGIPKVTSFCQRLIRSVKCLNQDITGKIHSFLYVTNVNITMAKKALLTWLHMNARWALCAGGHSSGYTPAPSHYSNLKNTQLHWFNQWSSYKCHPESWPFESLWVAVKDQPSTCQKYSSVISHTHSIFELSLTCNRNVHWQN